MLTRYEPTACRCEQCRQTCKTSPGILAPGDMQRIAAYVGAELTPEFTAANFHAADGERVCIDGEVMMVPTIVPKQHEDGRCVFLTKDERCSVFPVRPFGCSRQSACQPKNRGAHRLVMRAIMRSLKYLGTWTQLAMRFDD